LFNGVLSRSRLSDMNELERDCAQLIVRAQRFVDEGKINDALHILEINKKKFGKVSRIIKFNYYIVIGYIFILQGNLSEAVQTINKSLRIARLEKDNVKKASCYYLLGLVSHRKGDFRESNRKLRRAIRYLGGSEETALREKIMEVSMVNSILLGKPQDSGLVGKVVEPRGIFDMYIRAFQRFNLGMYKEALDDINLCNKEWGENKDHLYLSKGYYLSALIQYKTGRYNEALEEINLAIDKHIKIKDKIGLAKSHFLLGIIERSLGRLSEAKDAFSKAERLFGILNDQTAEYLSKVAREGLTR